MRDTLIKKIVILTLCAGLILPGLTSCKSASNIVLTTGFEAGQIFRIESEVCTKAELMVYLTNLQNGYESVYGQQIWDTEVNDVLLEDSIKEVVLARMARTKVMKLLARDKGVVLTDDEIELAEQAGKTYYAGLNETEIAEMGVNEDVIVSLYEEYALANKVYQYLIQDVNPEISDDEARTITVSHILIKTYSTNSNGEVKEYSDAAKAEAYSRAQEAFTRAQNGEDFEQLVVEYNEDSKSVYSFRKGEVSEAYETAAFNLGTNEMSQVIETEYGYCIIKCLNTFNREETDANKIKIVEERKEEVFHAVYEEYLKGLTGYLNEKEWDAISLVHDPNVTTNDFFEVYDNFFMKE